LILQSGFEDVQASSPKLTSGCGQLGQIRHHDEQPLAKTIVIFNRSRFSKTPEHCFFPPLFNFASPFVLLNGQKLRFQPWGD